MPLSRLARCIERPFLQVLQSSVNCRSIKRPIGEYGSYFGKIKESYSKNIIEIFTDLSHDEMSTRFPKGKMYYWIVLLLTKAFTRKFRKSSIGRAAENRRIEKSYLKKLRDGNIFRFQNKHMTKLPYVFLREKYTSRNCNTTGQDFCCQINYS